MKCKCDNGVVEEKEVEKKGVEEEKLWRKWKRRNCGGSGEGGSG